MKTHGRFAGIVILVFLAVMVIYIWPPKQETGETAPAAPSEEKEDTAPTEEAGDRSERIPIGEVRIIRLEESSSEPPMEWRINEFGEEAKGPDAEQPSGEGLKPDALEIAQLDWEKVKRYEKPGWMITAVRNIGRGQIIIETRKIEEPFRRKNYLLVEDEADWGIIGVAEQAD
ncbi:hypothetical protein [Kiritimatiella glycovorans]|uniref:Uncharacterized protein n=1 Tax=Kiritimatiella glycovorans TaxID=1307763 RepID=A0A0G3EKR6_9BACT|nr:hypothetical protein [Kiritimatiella glycovorans]AKJ64769.1 hypothetical protein L21SP4_01524 [Kiritimatiella glycovorans]